METVPHKAWKTIRKSVEGHPSARRAPVAFFILAAGLLGISLAAGAPSGRRPDVSSIPGRTSDVFVLALDGARRPPRAPDPPVLATPYAGAPPCPRHDPNSWHGLWDSEGRCHYAHTHNADPSAVENIFGPLPLDDSVSYPWQTGEGAENEHKHEGYKWSVQVHDGCVHRRSGFETHNCVTAWRLQYHSLGGGHEAQSRFHSFYGEFRVCTRDGAECGVVRTGGWADFGVLCVPYKGERVRLLADPPELIDTPQRPACNRPPYRGHVSARDPIADGDSLPYTWNSHPTFGWNQLLSFDFKVLDDWGGILPSNPAPALAEAFRVCPDSQCPYNHSTSQVYEIVLDVPVSDFEGFTDLQGNIDPTCRAPGPSCVPISIQGVPVGLASFRLRPAVHFDSEGLQEFDVSPPGEWWIRYPN